MARCSAPTAPFAGRIQWFEEVTSTNDVAAAFAENGAPEGMVVAADAQSAGRGRLGRRWSSPPGAGLYVSIVLRPPPATAPLLTIAAGVAVCEGIERATGATPDLKWPNDALISGRKVAGILAEAGATGAWLQHVVLGIGINLRPAAHPADLASTATSLEAELGREVDRGLVFTELLAALAGRYAELQQGEIPAIVAQWRRLATRTLGRRVEWESNDRVLRGTARDIDGSGALLVETPAGIERVIAGAIRWI
jgi:BirA family biotin operon repressor/biotin-[acetyl-CoA-carboxylase] ligase